MKKIISSIFLSLWVLLCSAQRTAEINKTFLLKSLRVAGALSSHPDQIKNLSGLQEGQEVSLPGHLLSDAIKRIYKSGLYEDVRIEQDSIRENSLYLSIQVTERQRITGVKISGLKKRQVEDIQEKMDMISGSLLSPSKLVKAKRVISNYLSEKGYYDARIDLIQKPDPILTEGFELEIEVDKGQKTKISRIVIKGNESFTKSQLKKTLKSLPEKSRLKFWKKSTFSDRALETAKQELLTFYQDRGFRDIAITRDSLSKTSAGDLVLHIELAEGQKFYHRNIRFVGNYSYSDSVLKEVLGIRSGDIYNATRLQEHLYGGMKHPGLSSLYLDNGYLFFNINPVETGRSNDSIDLELRIQEGGPTSIGKISLTGNTKTSDEVILRMLRTQPGNIFRRTDLMRSQRELIALNYFDPQTLEIIPKPNQETGTVDLEYKLTEKPSDKIQLSGGWSPRSKDEDGNIIGGGLIGTLQLTLTNFSSKRLFSKKSWNPIPGGDGQQLNLAFQSTGRRSSNVSINFLEPWLGGKKPNSLGFGLNYYSFESKVTDVDGSLSLFRTSSIAGSIDFGTRLNFPDDYTQSRSSLSYRYYDILNPGIYYPEFAESDQAFIHSITFRQTVNRNNLDHPVFPSSGSFNEISGEFTPPYSLFGNVSEYDNLAAAEKFKFLEYYKLMIKSQWFVNPIGKLVLQGRLDAGYLGAYKQKLGVSPFERFVLGGAGIMNASNGGIRGIEPIPLRGYKLQVFDNDGSYYTFFNRVSFEVRHPISLTPEAPIWVLGFAEAGNASEGISSYKFTDIKKSAGLGLRLQLPMIGLLGMDWGYGFDNDPSGQKSGHQFHFIFGKEF